MMTGRVTATAQKQKRGAESESKEHVCLEKDVSHYEPQVPPVLCKYSTASQAVLWISVLY